MTSYQDPSPRITIVTPVLNQVLFIEETILSVLSQNYNNLEYIIIDGGSTDGTLEIIKKYEKDITYWVSEPDDGMYNAIQKGFDRSTGEIMAWLNSDDKYKPDCLQMIASIFNDLELEWIVGIPSMYNKDSKCVKIFNLERWSRSRFWIKDYKWIQQENVFWRRSLWDKSGGQIYSELKYAGDFNLWCRFFNHTNLYSVNTSFAGFRLHGSQLSVDFKKEYESEAKKIIKAFKPKNIKDISRYFILYFLSITRTIIRYSFILLFLEPVLSAVIRKLHHFPGVIYYNFYEMKWKK